MILMLTENQMFLKCFYGNRSKYFHDSLSFELILVPVCEFFYAKCIQFPLTFPKLNQMRKIFPWELLSFIF